MSADNLPIKLNKARVELLLSHPFFASLCLRLNFAPDNVKTMETDGRSIYYGAKFVETLTLEELTGVVAHEAMHCALAHHCRRGSRDMDRWNDACDYAINPILLDNQLTLPAGALFKKEFVGLSAEEIYSKLLAEPQGQSGDGGQPPQNNNSSPTQSPNQQSAGANPPNPNPDQPGNSGGKGSGPGEGDPHNSKPKNDPARSQPTAGGATPDPGEKPSGIPPRNSAARPGAFGQVRDAVTEDGQPASEAEKSEQAHAWAIAAEQAANAAKSCGDTHFGIDRVLEESRRSKTDWRSILRQFIAATTPSDYRFFPPNRRWVHMGLYLPSIHKEGTGCVVIAVDTSGSVGPEELRQFAGEIEAVAEEAKPECIHIVFCDASVQSTQEFLGSETITLKPKGGGGTNFRPVFEWVQETEIRPVCLLYLTDLACKKYPATPPEYPVLWVTDSRRVAPFGETLQILAE